ncbi:hypothetical protein ACH3O9_11180 [Leeuwenhoekiella sp. A16]|uniref:hypothetical protein n=1 Tax=Leeuwenhoekiella sp. A16 TaxID=3141462 RepID=UPI003A7FF441
MEPLKIGKYNRYVWEDEHLNFLRKNFEKMSNQELADTLGIRLNSCRTKLYELGYKRMELQYWTSAQVNYLKGNYKTKGDTELAEIFNSKWKKPKGWTKKHIEKKRRYLKLKRSREERRQIKTRNSQLGYFKIGSKKAWETRGITPVGEIKIWEYSKDRFCAVIKTVNGFVHYNRWLYEQNFKPLSSDDLVVTRSGEIKAKGPADLLLIDRAENARRNSLLRYPEELRNTVKLIRKLNQELQNS